MIVDILGYSGLILNLVAVMAATRRRLLLVQICSSIAFAGHFLLLGAVAGALQVLVTIIRNILFLKVEKFKKPKYILYGILVLAIVLAIAGWQGSTTLLIMTSIILGTIGRWQSNLELLLIFSFIATVFTLLYALNINSMPAIISSLVQLVITSIAILRNESKVHFIHDRYRDWHAS